MRLRFKVTPLAIAATILSALVVLSVGAVSLKVGASPSSSTNVGGLISTDTTWTTGDSPVIVTSSILVQQGVTLTIEPGVEVRFDSGLILQANGELIARGSGAAPIHFTSNEAQPASGDWGFILFTDSSVDAVYDATGDYISGSILEHCTIEFAGAVSGSDYALRIDSSGPLIDHCTVKDNAGGGIDVNNGNVKIVNCTITGNTGTGIEGHGTITLSDNTITDNRLGISLGGNTTLSGNRITGNLGRGISTIGGSTILDSNTISGNGGGGINIAFGTVRLSDNTIMGNRASEGGGIRIFGATVSLRGDIIVDNEAASDGGGIWAYQTTIPNSITIDDSTISGNTASKGGGLDIKASSGFMISGSTISWNRASGHGGGINTRSAVSLSGNTVIGNVSSSSAVHGSGLVVKNNLFENESPYLIHTTSLNTSTDVNMENNWWGTTDTGDIAASIYDWFDDPSHGIVDYTPFLTQPNTGAPVSPPLGLVATGDADSLSIGLSWNANPEGDIAGYRVHYKTGDAGFPYDGSRAAEGDSGIDVGNVTGASLSILAPWVAYHIAVTGYDIDGNESWYSEDVTVTLGADTTPPYTSGHDPASGAAGVPIDTNILVHVRDDGAGVDQSSIVLTVESVDVSVDASDRAVPTNVMPTDSYSFTTVATGAIQGNVYLQGNTDHAGVAVTANGFNAITAGDGSYTFSNVPPGSYAVTAGTRGFLSATKGNVTVVGAATTVVGDVTLLVGDLDNNGAVDIRDLAAVARNLGNTETPWP